MKCTTQIGDEIHLLVAGFVNNVVEEYNHLMVLLPISVANELYVFIS